jgi:DNA-directed RNA polymerase specialized sigma24 family protein
VSAGVFDFLLSGKTVEEAAAAFKMSEAAVHKVKQRVRDRLKELIRAQIEDEDALERTA